LASAENSNNPRVFTGTEQRSLDDNHRVTVPSRWRYDGLSELFAFPDPRSPFLILMPIEELQKIASDLENADDIDPALRRKFVRQLFSRAQGCGLDRQGRLVLPAEMCSQLGLGGEVVLAGTGTRIEVWAPDRWSANADDEQTSFADVADRVGL
jgi:MraZ protein